MFASALQRKSMNGKIVVGVDSASVNVRANRRYDFGAFSMYGKGASID